jgi:hypothetical protein
MIKKLLAAGLFSIASLIASTSNGAGSEVCVTVGCGPVSVASGTLAQYMSDDSSVSSGGVSTDNILKFKGTIQVATGTVQLQVEVQQAGTNFTGTPNATSTYVASGTIAVATFPNLANRPYHWQARGVVSSTGAASPWIQPFTTSTSAIDFRVSSLTNAGSEYFSATSSDGLVYSGSSTVFAATDSSTVEFWYRSAAPTSSILQFIDTRQTNASSNYEGYFVNRDQDNGIQFFLACDSGIINFHAASSSARNNGTGYDVGGVWHQVAITKNNTTSSSAFVFYFDGVSQSPDWTGGSQGPISGNCFVSSTPKSIYLGKAASSTPNYLTGNLDEVRIWKTERSASQISGLWNSELLGVTSDVIGLWHFNATTTEFVNNLATSSQSGGPVFASSTPFGHFIYGYNWGWSYPVSNVNTTTRQILWNYPSPSNFIIAVNYASGIWNALSPIRIASTTATSSAAGMDLKIDEVNTSSAPWTGISAYTAFPATSTLTLNAYYLDSCGGFCLDSLNNRIATTHEFGHSLGLDHSYSGNIMFYTVNNPATTTLGDQDKSDYHFIWGGN